MIFKPIETIQNELHLLSQYEVIIFGSYVEGGFGPNSDIDICILSHSKVKEEDIRILEQFQCKIPPIYELHIFESSPITIQYSIWSNYHVLFGNDLEISEYLYEYRKIWRDCKHRILGNQFSSAAEQWKKLLNARS